MLQAIIFAEETALTTTNVMFGAITSGFTAMLGLMAWVLRKLIDTTIPQQQTTFTTAINKLIDQTIPGLQATFSDGVEKQRKAFTEALDRQQAAFSLAQENFQKIVDATHKNFQATLDKVQASHKDDVEKEREFYRSAFRTQLMEFHREEDLSRERFLDTLHVLTNPDVEPPDLKSRTNPRSKQ